ncbi:alpha/beta fold hydrolase [Amycolatopsis jejuensis]|uniref:alpha/beta fold hydrolase n=1 Tax=Amycolatopsis jejuensis TaxID=330084 RepID=UPI00068E7496|nr:alpha/beta hydrolase family protein [Amycolatopsis jejuensis]
MAVFVLVHGAYHGGWCWRRVSDRLRAQGHTVHTPTLTGLGERAHLLTPAVGLQTMIDDVVGTCEAEEVTDAILVGHSFGALPVLGALPRVSQRLTHVVVLDGIVARPGTSGFAALNPDALEERTPTGPFLPPPPPSMFGVTTPDDAAWLTRRLTPHPLQPYLDPFPAPGPLGAGVPVTYLRCTAPLFPGVDGSARLAETEGWTMRELAATHDAMITHPGELTSELTGIAARRRTSRWPR